MSQRRDIARGTIIDDDQGTLDPDDERVEDRLDRGVRRLALSPLVRRISPRKLLIGLGIGLACTMVTVYLGARLARYAVAWLHDQSAYQVAFESIALDPPPPAWVRSGAAGLLRRVHARSRWHDQATLPVLSLDPEELAAAFSLGSPWVREVLGVETSYPNRLTVRLAFREPVAWLRLGTPEQGRTLFLDGDGVVLPFDDLDVQAAMPLVQLHLPLPADQPLDEKDGLALALAPSSPGSKRVEVAREPCRLAAFLKRRGAIAGTGTNRSPLRATGIHETKDGVWILTGEKALILWEPFERSGLVQALSPDERWSAIEDWLSRHRLEDVQWPHYLRFDEGELKVFRSA